MLTDIWTIAVACRALDSKQVGRGRSLMKAEIFASRGEAINSCVNELEAVEKGLERREFDG